MTGSNNNRKNNKTSPSVIDILSLLDAYTASHTSGNQSIKSCVLNITKARRLQGGCIDGDEMSAYYSACQVREELLRARAIVTTCKQTHNEDDDRFYLSLDGSLKISTEDQVEDESLEVENEALSKQKEDGLRRRKKGLDDDDQVQPESFAWTTTTTEIEQPHETVMDEEILRSMDPITLFGGFSPLALKGAQKNARQALSSYIEAANLASYLLSLIGDGEKKV